MRHKKKRGRFARKSAQRKALVRGLARELVLHERITTTAEKAKVTRSEAERLITIAKKGGLANFRRAVSLLGDKTLARKLFDDIAPRFADRRGGYTRVVRMARNRIGDNGSKAILELVVMNKGEKDAAED